MLEVNTLRARLHEHLCGDLTVDRRPDGELMVRTPFEFPDGDRYPIHLSELPGGGGLRLSDRGHTLMHISYEHDVDTFMDEPRGRLVNHVIARVVCAGTAAHSAWTPPWIDYRQLSSGSDRP